MAIPGCRFGMALVCFSLGVFAARFASEPANNLQADDKKAPDTFLSGGARSEKVLVEILATLKQLDGRVAGIEEVLRKGNTPRDAERGKTKELN